MSKPDKNIEPLFHKKCEVTEELWSKSVHSNLSHSGIIMRRLKWGTEDNSKTFALA